VFLRKSPLRKLAGNVIARFGVKARGPDARASSLSGGNLQKYVVGRELSAAPKLLVVAQPTWGVDVGAAAQIRSELLELRDSGSALLLVSEELDELLELSDALVVMSNGRVSPRLPRRDATRSLIGQWMSGLWPEAASDASLAYQPEERLAETGAPS
jgi:simple sugar transport system ATP-binding protein